MLTRQFHSVFEQGPVPVRLDVYADDGSGETGQDAIDGAVGTSTLVDAAEGSRLRVERVGTDYGSSIYASFAEINLFDDGTVRDLFGPGASAYDEADYLCVLSAESYTTASGTVTPAFVWYGRPMRSRAVPTIAPSVYAEGATTLRLYDGLATLSNLQGGPATRRTILESVVGPVQQVNRHLAVYWRPGAWPTVIGDATSVEHFPTLVRWQNELAGTPSRGDYGTVREQVERALESQGLVLYQHTTPDAGGPDGGAPAFRIVPRAALGQQLLDAVRIDNFRWLHTLLPAGESPKLGWTYGSFPLYTSSAVNIAADSVRLDADDIGGTERDTVEGVDGAALVKLTSGSESANLVRGQFPRTVSDSYTELLTSVVPDADGTVRVRVDVTFAALGEARYRLRLEGASGTTHYLTANVDPADGLTFTWETTPYTLSIDSPSTIIATEGVPEAGDLLIDLFDTSGNNDVAYLAVSVGFADANGNQITDWTVLASPDYLDGTLAIGAGATATIRRPPGIEKYYDTGSTPDDELWDVPAEWETTLYTDSNGNLKFRSLSEFIAYDRLAQQGKALAAPRCTVEGLHGPGRLLRFPGALLGRSVLVDNVPCIVGGGLVLNLDAGTTEGGWTELVTNALD